ncbi:hypothetical protein [Arthrobacter cavernae]|uniref:Uncharacterized protein n=1 Tax=Arthrobacter cavernae TaxID=2817681 RepID=A0A939KK11_9MICC|nr:hypothetical protein [Arthrobacter cavernae]MBO1268289.1 hypothetical protein [Arthrobacter cavernae]
MVLNRNTPRTDITYLTRRRKPAQAGPPAQSAPTQAAPSPASPAAAGTGLDLRGGLDLGRSPAHSPDAHSPAGTAPAPPPARTDISAQAFPAPAFGSVRQLSETDPVVRLNARQSGIGTLLVGAARSVTWEDNNLITGACTARGDTAGTAVRTSGNRPLAGFSEQSAAVSLRHVRQLRRALFIAGESPLTIGIFDGTAAAASPRNQIGERTVLYVSRIGSVLEMRVEFVPAHSTDEDIWAAFGFTMTIPLDQRAILH